MNLEDRFRNAPYDPDFLSPAGPCTFPSCSCNITCPGVPEPRNFPVFIALGGFFGIIVAMGIVGAFLYGVLP